MESKYGRLFTEADVLALVQAAFERGCAELDGADYPGLLELLADTRLRLTFPADEPLFLLRFRPEADEDARLQEFLVERRAAQ